MEINKTTICGHEIAVIFNGTNYFFYSEYYGLICNAERVNEDYNRPSFALSAGNRYTIGTRLTPDTIRSAAKRFISRVENKYISKCIAYITDGATCDNQLLTIHAITI